VTFRDGSKVIYPRLGICRVVGTIEQTVGGQGVRFYSLKPVDHHDSTHILVPVEKAKDVGVRRLIDRTEIPKLLRFLGKDIEVATDHRKRNARNAERISSGEIFQVADSLKTMVKLSKGKTLSPEEQQTLSRARQLLTNEIAYVMKSTIDDVSDMIEQALAGKKSRAKRIAA
jgi:Transcriptional regulators, similar to M. xanthus CarD